MSDEFWNVVGRDVKDRQFYQCSKINGGRRCQVLLSNDPTIAKHGSICPVCDRKPIVCNCKWNALYCAVMDRFRCPRMDN